MKTPLFYLSLLLLAGSGLAGCAAVGPDYAPPETAVPAGWAQLDPAVRPMAHAEAPGDLSQWWQSSETFLLSDPITEKEWNSMAEEIRNQLSSFPFPKAPLSMISIGGTGTALASVELGLEKFNPGKSHRFVLTREALKNQLFLYRSKTVEERKTIKGLPSARAEVILAGGTILYLIMEASDSSSFMVSTHGIRYGLLYKKLNL